MQMIYVCNVRKVFNVMYVTDVLYVINITDVWRCVCVYVKHARGACSVMHATFTMLVACDACNVCMCVYMHACNHM